MPLEVAFPQEVFQGDLFKPGLPVAHLRLEHARTIPVELGNGRIADTEARADRFRERADVKYATAAVEARESRQRRSVVAKIAVVVVLDDEAVGFLRPAKQREPPVQRHQNARRELVRRGDVKKVALRLRKIVDDDARVIDIDWSDRPPCRVEQESGPLIAGVLDAEARDFAAQQLIDEVERILTASWSR